MTLLFTFLGCALGFTALFWLVAVSVQSYLYSQPVNMLPVRAVVCGIVMAGFVTAWTYVNTRASHLDKYGTLFDMQPTERQDVERFEAVRQLQINGPDGKPKEEIVPYVYDDARNQRFYQENNAGEPFILNSSLFLTTAILIPENEGSETINRYVPEMDGAAYVREDGETVLFTQEKGSRYFTTSNLHHLFIPSTKALFFAVIFNLTLFLLWFGVCSYGLQFSIGHALGLTALFGIPTLLILMPLLFEKNTVMLKLVTPVALVESPDSESRGA